VKQRLEFFIKKISHYIIPSQLVAVINTCIAFIALGSLWWYVGGLLEKRLLYEDREDVAGRMESIGTSLTLSISQRLSLVTGLHSYVLTEVNDYGQLNADKLAIFATSIYTQMPGIRNIALAPAGVMQFVYPYEENKSVLGYEPSKDERPNVREEIQRAIETGKIILSNPYELIQGGQGLIARQAVFTGDRYWGLVNIVIDVPPLLEEAGISPPPFNLNLAIKDQSGKVFYGARDVFISDPIVYSVSLPEGEWVLAGIPNKGWQSGYQTSLWIYRLLGLGVVITISLMVYQFTDRRERLTYLVEQRTNELTQSNQTLINALEGINAAEITLRETAARYKAVVENQTEFIVRWKPDGMRTFANEAYLRYFNLSLDEALSSGFLSLVVEEDRNAVEGKVSRLVSGESFSETEVHKVIKPDGSIGWQEWTDNAIFNDQGQLVEFQSVGRDVTERILADEALRMKTEELEALFSISSHLRTAQSADAMLPVVLAEMRRVLHSDANAVILLDPDNEHFTYALSDGPLKVNDGTQFEVAKSISGLVLQTRHPYITENLSSDPHKTSRLQGDDELGPAIIVPVISESEFLGVLLCTRKKDSNSKPYSSTEARLLTAIGEMVGNALRRARLYDQAMARLQHVQTLHSIDMAISANLDLSVILDVLLTQGVTQLNVDAASILLLDPHTHMLEYAASKGFRTKEIKSARLHLGEGLPGKIALERKVLHIPNLGQTDDFIRKYLLDEGFVSYQAAPLIAKGQLQGVLETFNRKPISVGEEQTGFLETLATQAAIAIDNSQLFSDLQRSNFELEIAYDATIEGWSRALELRDQETEGHTLRVTDMTLRLAQELGVRGADLIHIRRGALLHDIGKMGIPDGILLKPGKLVDEEWEIMKRHTVYAFEMLWPIEFLRPAIDIPYCHHERWDGTGYPRQLKGDQIPLSARLFAVADVWDALTSDRPYRKAWIEEEALDYIVSNASKHFDPQVVELFLILRNKSGKELIFE